MPEANAPRHPTTVRARLIGMVLAFMVPTVVAAIVSIAYVYFEERRAFEQGVREATRALSLVVDRELAQREAVLRTLAHSPALRLPALDTFYEYAKKIAPDNDSVIIVSDLAGQQLINTRRAIGEALPKLAPRAADLDPMATSVSDLYFAPFGRNFSFAVQVPVVIDGQLRYYLSMGSFARQLQPVLEEQRLPPTWIGSIVDRRGVIVARSANADKFVGKNVTAQMLARLQSDTPEGSFPSRTVDKMEVFASYSRSQRYGWSFLIGVPREEARLPLQAAAWFGAGALALMAVALLNAIRLGRRLMAPVAHLVGVAEAMGRAEPVVLGPTGLIETDTVASALQKASVSIAQAQSEMQKQVAAALAEAEKAQRALIQHHRLEAIGHLTGGVAHDFNNLLMVVNNNVHLMRRKRPELTPDPQLASIERAVSTGSKLTRQLLTFARRQALRPEMIDLSERLPDLMQLIKPTLRSGIEAVCTVSPATAPFMADPAEFELAIINLAVNSRDAIEGAGRFSITARNARPDETVGMEGRYVLVEVADNGCGIAPEALGHVFEPFFTTKPVGHGTGLGLSQVYGFAVQAGGTATVESAPGSGTVVRIFLRALEGEHLAERRPREPGAQLASVRVLLVEDNLELAQVTRELLDSAGCIVSYAQHGDDAVRLLTTDSSQLDVVLSDIRMPGAVDGIALAEHIRKHYPRLPVVLMSGYSAELSKAGALELPVLPKPCSPAELFAALGKAVSVKE